MGNSPRDCGPCVLGNGWALFLSGGELSSWGVVLEPFILLNVFSCICTYSHIFHVLA